MSTSMSYVIDEDEIYVYEILQEKHLDESSRLLADSFTKYNPLEVYSKTTYEQFYPYALALSKLVLDDQLSVVAIDKRTKEIHGLAQAGDAKKLAERPFEEFEAFKDTVEVLDELEQRFMKHYGELKENDLVDIMLVGVRHDCSGKGLGTKLQRILLDHCRRRRYKCAIVQTTNPATYHIYTKKLNGKEFTSVYLPTFQGSDQRKPFKDYNETIRLIVLDLQEKKK